MRMRMRKKSSANRTLGFNNLLVYLSQNPPMLLNSHCKTCSKPQSSSVAYTIVHKKALAKCKLIELITLSRANINELLHEELSD